MKSTRYEGPFSSRAGEWIGDLTVWTRQNAGDNSERLERLRRNLRQARERELTPRQRQLLELYYERGMNIPQIAEELGLNRSTVSRTLRRARDRLYRCLRYAL
ncbi:MAG: sigma-70 family RNA polymerase sigma factor [Dysosmobacter sp.]|nr:sigma-70 family RNA polymerase sigma factor [Dysosmobacter sp.]